jgi:ABC-type polysaccharide/polyol phosphate export permease
MIISKFFELITNSIPENNRLERIWKLAQVDFKKRYYNDRFGLVWAFLNPLFRVAIYSFIFTNVFNRIVDGIDNFAIFLFIGIITWRAFSESVNKGLRLMYSKLFLIENIQLEKSDLFISHTFSVFIGYGFNLMMFLCFSFTIGTPISINILILPILIFNAYLISVGAAMLVGVIYIYIKDIKHMLDIILLFGFWSSGIFFQGKKLLEFLPLLLYANPFVGIIINL